MPATAHASRQVSPGVRPFDERAPESPITIADLCAAVRAGLVPLAGETAGYLALALADHLARTPTALDPAALILSPEGSISLLGLPPARSHDDDDAAAARFVRELLSQWLSVSQTPPPALRALVRRSRAGEVDIALLIEDLEQALIPVNRGAARRGLSRLARETQRVRNAGGLSQPAELPLPLPKPAEPPAQTAKRAPAIAAPPVPEAPPVPSLIPPLVQPAEAVIPSLLPPLVAPARPEPVAVDAGAILIAAQTAYETEAAPAVEPSSDELDERTVVDTSLEALAPSPVAAKVSQPPAAASAPDEPARAPISTTQPLYAPARTAESKPAPPPAATPTARILSSSAARPADDLFATPAPQSVDALLADYKPTDDIDELAVARSMKMSVGLEPTAMPPAVASFEQTPLPAVTCDDALPPRSEGDALTDPRALPSYAPKPPRSPRLSLALMFLLLVLGLGAALLIWVMYPGFFSGRLLGALRPWRRAKRG